MCITDYIMYVFLARLPLYLIEAQNFSLQKMGIAAPSCYSMGCNELWLAAILTIAASAVIGIVAWLAVKPDTPLALKENNNLEKIA